MLVRLRQPRFQADVVAVAGGLRSPTPQRRPDPGDPTVIVSLDEFGPLNRQPHPGRQWATGGAGGPQPRRRRRATSTRTAGGRHLVAGYHLTRDRISGHVQATKNRTTFLASVRYLRSLCPLDTRIAIVLDNFSPHLSTRLDSRVGDWRGSTTSSWPTPRPTPAGSTGSRRSSRRCATAPSTAPTTPRPEEQARMIRRHLGRRNPHADDEKLPEIVARAQVA
jgi:hypothetical protein